MVSCPVLYHVWTMGREWQDHWNIVAGDMFSTEHCWTYFVIVSLRVWMIRILHGAQIIKQGSPWSAESTNALHETSSIHSGVPGSRLVSRWTEQGLAGFYSPTRKRMLTQIHQEAWTR